MARRSAAGPVRRLVEKPSRISRGLLGLLVSVVGLPVNLTPDGNFAGIEFDYALVQPDPPVRLHYAHVRARKSGGPATAVLARLRPDTGLRGRTTSQSSRNSATTP